MTTRLVTCDCCHGPMRDLSKWSAEDGGSMLSVMLPKTPSERQDICLDCTKRIFELRKQPEPAEPA